MHDWAYDLGFTETAFNMQVDNFGKGGAPGDPELGNAQGGALTGGMPTYTGRDNANQPRSRTASRRSRTCTCGSRWRAPSTRPASTATSTCR